jgi:hypothetical protein
MWFEILEPDMEIIADWYINDRVIYHRPVGDETIEIVQQNNDDLVKLLDQGVPLVHVIVDARFVTKFPTSILKLSKAATFLSHSSLGWVITVSNNPVITFLGGMLPQIGSVTRYRVVSELDSALTFLKEQDTTLDWSTVNEALLSL